MALQAFTLNSIFRNNDRTHRTPTEVAEHVCEALRAYDVQAVDTLNGLISPPAELMQTLTDRKIAQELQKT
ncbi:MAG: hypothetical protein LH628_16910 [Microcoleus sp. CAN_BIN18]|nr:hypothetical protein [Microcoleus sp. CAN_BIN18]